MKNTLFFLMLILGIGISNAQIVVTQGISPVSGVQNVLLGSGVTISNIQYSGVANSFGTFTTGSTPTNLGLTNGIVMSSGLVSEAAGAVSDFASTSNGTGSDPQLAGLVTQDVEDAAVLEFDFIPLSDTVQFRYVFGSEEYPEFVGDSFNDAFGFFISGPNPFGASTPYVNKNIAIIPGSTLPVTINNVNSSSYSQFYVNNESPANAYIAYDGMTTVMTAMAAVVPCQTYHIKIAIGDVFDDIYDSGVFLEANSFTSPGMNAELHFESDVRQNCVVEGCSNADIVFRLPQVYNENVIIHFSTGGSAQRDVDYHILPNVDSLVIFAGADTGYIHIEPIQDYILDPGDTIFIIVPGVGCSNAVDTLKIPVIDNSPIVLNVAEDQLLCDGGMGFLTVSASQGVSPYTYSWSNGAGNVTSQDVLPEHTTTYIVSATDLCNNLSVDSIKVVIGSLMYTISNDTTVCSGVPLTIGATFDGNVQWTGFGTNPINIIANQTKVYPVTMSNFCGVVHDSVRVNVYPMPTLSLGNDETLCDYETKTLQINGTYERISWSYSYDYFNFTVLDTIHPQYVADTTGVYTVVVRNGFCSDSSLVRLTFIPCDITAPNVFTPNGDGVNDFFQFTNLEYYSGSRLVIYNRWGRKVYEASDYHNDWNGENLSDGLYYYILYLPSKVTLNGSGKWMQEVSGSVTILR